MKHIALMLGCALLLGATGCSWLVDPWDPHPRCDVDGGDGSDAGNPCPSPMTCQNGKCRPPCAPEDVCGNLIDDDCNGIVDDRPLDSDYCGDGINNDCDQDTDEGSDVDADGYNWCPLRLGQKAQKDCDDERKEVFPGAPELCDGLDNDCDNAIDDAPPGSSLCSADEKCELGRCVKLTCLSGDPRFACGAGTLCSPRGTCEPLPVGCGPSMVTCAAGEECRAGMCQARAKLANGSPCAIDNDCRSNMCVDAPALRMPGMKVCAQACCNDAGCSPGERCFASGTGARSCLPAEILPSAVVPYRQCSNDDACIKDVQECALENDQELKAPYTPAVENLTTTVCRAEDASPSTRTVGEICTGAASCSNSICVPGALWGTICSKPCGHSGECKELAMRAYANNGGRPAYCRFVPVHGSEGPRPPDYASICVLAREGELGPKKWGDTCMSPQECDDRGCIVVATGEPARCLPTCCDNSMCVTENARAGTCRPFKVGMGYEMRCLYPPPSSPSAQPR